MVQKMQGVVIEFKHGLFGLRDFFISSLKIDLTSWYYAFTLIGTGIGFYKNFQERGMEN